MPDLEKMTAAELHALASEATAMAERKKSDERRALREEFAERARAAGYSLEEILGASSPRRAASPRRRTEDGETVRYRDPENPANTWSGRGRKPNWIREAERDGRSPEDFAV